MNTPFVKNLLVFISFIFISASSFAQTTPWYVGAFSAADGSKLLITESRVYGWTAQGKGYIMGDYTAKDVYLSSDGGMLCAWEGQPNPFGDPGLVELELTADKTIVDVETVYKKNPNLMNPLRNEADKLDQKKALEVQAYTDFIEANKWLQGVWTKTAEDRSGRLAYLFVFPQGLFFIDPSMDDGKVWQLETKAEVEYSDYSRRPATKNDTSGTVFLGGVFPVDMSAKTIQFYFTEEQLKKCNL